MTTLKENYTKLLRNAFHFTYLYFQKVLNSEVVTKLMIGFLIMNLRH